MILLILSNLSTTKNIIEILILKGTLFFYENRGGTKIRLF